MNSLFSVAAFPSIPPEDLVAFRELLPAATGAIRAIEGVLKWDSTMHQFIGGTSFK